MQAELDKAGVKKAKGQASQEAARKKVLNRFLGITPGNSGFRDPAAFFTAE